MKLGQTHKQRLREVVAQQVARNYHHLSYEKRAEMVARVVDEMLAPTPAPAPAHQEQPDPLVQEAFRKCVE